MEAPERRVLSRQQSGYLMTHDGEVNDGLGLELQRPSCIHWIGHEYLQLTRSTRIPYVQLVLNTRIRTCVSLTHVTRVREWAKP